MSMYINNKSKSTDFDAYIKKIGNKSALGLIDIYNNSEISGKKNLLVIIDQIEDLFLNKKFFDSENSDDDNLLIDIIYNFYMYSRSTLFCLDI